MLDFDDAIWQQPPLKPKKYTFYDHTNNEMFSLESCSVTENNFRGSQYSDTFPRDIVAILEISDEHKDYVMNWFNQSRSYIKADYVRDIFIIGNDEDICSKLKATFVEGVDFDEGNYNKGTLSVTLKCDYHQMGSSDDFHELKYRLREGKLKDLLE